MDPLGVALGVVVLGTILASIAVVGLLDHRSGEWVNRVRSRFVLGVPWGTIVVTTFVIAVYLFVQDGVTDVRNPVTLPYRSWSYAYPLGMVTAPFSHASLGHVVSNLAGTIVLAPIVEYVWGHYPRDRSAEDGESSTTPATDRRVPRSLVRLYRRPLARAFVIFPLAALAVGLFTSLFAVGPIIGFSGVVFAFAGFAIVRYPLGTVLAVVGGQSVVATLFWAIQSPIVVQTVSASPPAPPSWATIAIQGHAIGFFAGLLLALVVFRRRAFRPDPVRFWLALVLFGFAQGLWQVYWYGADGSYVLFQGPGVALVVAMALVVTLAMTASDRPVVPAGLFDRVADTDGEPVARIDRVRELSAGTASALGSRSVDRIGELVAATPVGAGRGPGPGRRTVALLVVLLVFASITGPAVPLNMFEVDDTDATDADLVVEDYAITYDQEVENRLISTVPLDRLADETTVRASGVIVWSEDRNLWTNAVTSDSLAFSGESTVELGGPGWRTTVTAEREGWTPVGNESVYQVRVSEDGAEPTLAYASDPKRADTTVANRSVGLVADHEDAFGVVVGTDDSGTIVAVPEDGETVDVDDLTVRHDDGTLYLETDDTSAVMATEETYVDG